MNRKTIEYEAVIKSSDMGKGGAYVTFPYDEKSMPHLTASRMMEV